MSNNLISVDSLDFDGIKTNIKNFLKGQSVFQDYNYEGSALSTLIDVLAYNTHYNALYTNMMLNESFLDSASKYSSVVSLAKSIGYTAKSTKQSIAKIRLEVSDVPYPEDVMTLPKGTYFRGSVGNAEYSFYSREAVTASNSNPIGENGLYTFEIDIVEGTPVTNFYTVTDSSSFVMNNLQQDLSTLKVSVQENSQSSVIQTFYAVDDLLNVRGIDNVYFVKQLESGHYEVYFGNDVIGKQVQNGNIVYLDYMVSSGEASNSCSQFYYSGGFRGDVLYQTTVIESSIGGADKEQIESIKYNAPRAYVTQNRAVTASDYKTLIQSNFPQVEAIQVWGGQDNVPRKYGVVFISAKPYGDRSSLNSQEKTEILEFLDSNKAIMTVQHEFYDPEILEIEVDLNAYYTPRLTTKSEGDLRAIISSSVQTYSNQMNTFESSFRFSKFQKAIDESERSIVSNITKIKVQKKIQSYYGQSYQYFVDFGNPIFNSANQIYSSRFYVPDQTRPCMISLDDNSVLCLYVINTDSQKTKIKTIGSVDFSKGSIKIDELIITALYDESLKFTMTPSSNDVVPVRNHIIRLPLNKLKINMIVDAVGAGTSNAGMSHIFSESR